MPIPADRALRSLTLRCCECDCALVDIAIAVAIACRHRLSPSPVAIPRRHPPPTRRHPPRPSSPSRQSGPRAHLPGARADWACGAAVTLARSAPAAPRPPRKSPAPQIPNRDPRTHHPRRPRPRAPARPLQIACRAAPCVAPARARAFQKYRAAAPGRPRSLAPADRARYRFGGTGLERRPVQLLAAHRPPKRPRWRANQHTPARRGARGGAAQAGLAGGRVVWDLEGAGPPPKCDLRQIPRPRVHGEGAPG